MKTKIFITAIILSFFTISSFGQLGMGNGPCFNEDSTNYNKFMGIPNLTEKQTEQIKKIKIEHLKKVTQKQNLLKEKRAHLKVLMTQDNPDRKAIDKTIGEINSLRSDLFKERVNMQLKVRSLLNEEQKVYFDRKKSKMGMHKKNRHKGCKKRK